MENAILKGVVQIGRIVLPPLAHRVGTGFAVYLVAKGVPEDLVHRTITAAGVLAGLSLDVVTSILFRRRT